MQTKRRVDSQWSSIKIWFVGYKNRVEQDKLTKQVQLYETPVNTGDVVGGVTEAGMEDKREGRLG